METELPPRPSATEEMLFLEARQGMRMLQVRPGQSLGRAWSTWLAGGGKGQPLRSPHQGFPHHTLYRDPQRPGHLSRWSE